MVLNRMPYAAVVGLVASLHGYLLAPSKAFLRIHTCMHTCMHAYIHTKHGSKGEVVRPISLLTLWISEGFTQAYSLNLKGWNSHVHRGFPGKLESSNLSRDNVSKEIGRRAHLLVRSWFIWGRGRTLPDELIGYWLLWALCHSKQCAVWASELSI